MLSLIVTADDFGIGLETSRGIIRAHLNGPVTATSLMVVTGDHARASVPLLADAPNLDVGLHLVLTRCGEKPLMARQSSGLVDRDGEFFTNGKLWARAYMGKLDRAGVADEIAAQTELFHKLMGRAPDYVDGHHHSHQLPTIREALVDVMTHDLLPRVTRISTEAKKRSAKSGIGSVEAKGRQLSRQNCRKGLCHHLGVDQRFILRHAQCRQPAPAISLGQVPGGTARLGVIEWVVHPGHPDETLKGRDDYNAHRATELTALTSSEQMHHWEKFRSNLGRKSILHKRGTPTDE